MQMSKQLWADFVETMMISSLHFKLSVQDEHYNAMADYVMKSPEHARELLSQGFLVACRAEAFEQFLMGEERHPIQIDTIVCYPLVERVGGDVVITEQKTDSSIFDDRGALPQTFLGDGISVDCHLEQGWYVYFDAFQANGLTGDSPFDASTARTLAHSLNRSRKQLVRNARHQIRHHGRMVIPKQLQFGHCAEEDTYENIHDLIHASVLEEI